MGPCKFTPSDSAHPIKNMSRPFSFLCVFLIVSTSLPAARAEIRLPGFFGDHMVIQQDMPLRIWGWGEVGESVEVTLGDHSETTTVDASGRWQVKLPAMKAGHQPHRLRVAGSNTIDIKDVLIGEVWLCSGQSNMEWTVQASKNSAAEIAAADYPAIRHMKIPRQPSTVAQDDVQADWQVCSPETAASFTAVGYFMARKLHKELDVPIGLINSSWGGTRVEPWTPPIGFQKTEPLKDIYQSVLGRTPGSEPFRNRLSQHIAATENWLAKAKGALESNDPIEASPGFPAELTPFRSHQDPTMLYNGMIHALVGFPIRGAIWYQGESNHAEGMLYFEKKKALINGWRELWGQGDFPFYYVQIAPFQYGNEDPTILAKFWEAQAAVQQIPNTGMVVINDIATLNDIHPPNKQDVGARLALWALKHDYGRSDVVASSPQMESLQVLDDRLRIHFGDTAGGLKTRDGKPPSHFEVIGPGSRGYRPAKAKIDGEALILTSDEVPHPVAFRFAWHKAAQPNLTGGTGLPVGAFRGGKEPDFSSLLSIEDDYDLVYQLDLDRLKPQIRYDVDHSDQIGSFDRIGYLLELRSSQHGDQKVFVSMNAFTDDVKKIGIPTTASNASFRQPVDGMEVFTNVETVAAGRSLSTGNIEFWPNNYGPHNGGGVRGASNGIFDFGDEPGEPRDGYGSMQVHNFGAGQTIFAINHWRAEAKADIGIGNSPGGNRDWTFSSNADKYEMKVLRVYVRPKE